MRYKQLTQVERYQIYALLKAMGWTPPHPYGIDVPN